MLDDGACATGVVDVDGVEGSSANCAIEKHDGMRVGEIGHERLRVDVGRHDDDSVDSPTHRAHGALDLALVMMRVGDDEVISGSSCRDINSADDFREELSVEIGEENSDGVGAAGDEASRTTVRDVAESSGNVPDTAAGFFADRSAAVE